MTIFTTHTKCRLRNDATVRVVLVQHPTNPDAFMGLVEDGFGDYVLLLDREGYDLGVRSNLRPAQRSDHPPIAQISPFRLVDAILATLWPS